MTKHYRIKFEPNLQQLVFETIRYFVTTHDIIQVVRQNFNIYHREIMVYDGQCMLKNTDLVENGKTYIIKCPPCKRRNLVVNKPYSL